MHQNSFFELKNRKNFLGRGAQPPPQTSPLVGRGAPHQRLRRLDPRAYGARPRPQVLPRVLLAPSDAPVTEMDP